MKVIKQLSDCDFIYINCRLHRAVLVKFWIFINNFSGVKKEANTVTSSYFVIQVLILIMMTGTIIFTFIYSNKAITMYSINECKKDNVNLPSLVIQHFVELFQVFNISVSYNAILGVILAFAAAIASRIILDELSM